MSTPATRPVAMVCNALTAVVVTLAAWAASPVAARSLVIEDFAVDLRVEESAGLAVTETIRVRFDGEWNGIHRAIPIQTVTSRGERRNLGFHLESVTDESGTRLETQKRRRGADVNLRIRVPGAVDAVRTVVICYRITAGLRKNSPVNGTCATVFRSVSRERARASR